MQQKKRAVRKKMISLIFKLDWRNFNRHTICSIKRYNDHKMSTKTFIKNIYLHKN